MASSNQVNADNLAIVPYEVMEVNAYNLAIVPYKRTFSTMSQVVVAAEPISFVFRADLARKTSSGRRRSFRTARKSENISMDQFSLNLPEDCMKYLSSKELTLLDYKIETNCAPHGLWFNISFRLKGWQCERRVRKTNHRVDKHFYHANMKLRSLKELIFYVKYGFMPCKSQVKGTENILEEAKPSPSRSSSYLDRKEQELMTRFNLEKSIIVQVNQHIKRQLLWTKHRAKPAGNPIGAESG